MKINESSLVTVKFKHINSGDVFSYDGLHYIKIIGGIHYNAAALENGCLATIDSDVIVTPYRNAELNLGQPL